MTFAGMNTARLGWAGIISVRGRGTSLDVGKALAAARLLIVVSRFCCPDAIPTDTYPNPNPIRHRLRDTRSEIRLTSTAARTAAPCHHRPSYPPKAELPLRLQLHSHPLLRLGSSAVELVWSGRRESSAIRPSLRGGDQVRARRSFSLMNVSRLRRVLEAYLLQGTPTKDETVPISRPLQPIELTEDIDCSPRTRHLPRAFQAAPTVSALRPRCWPRKSKVQVRMRLLTCSWMVRLASIAGR